MKKLSLIFMLIMALFVAPIAVMAGTKTVEFTWEQNISDDFGGWTLWKSVETGGPYAKVTDIAYVSTQSTYISDQIISAPDGQTTTFYFVLSAFDISQNQSGYSNEVSEEFDFEAPDDPSSFSLIIKVEGQ